VRHVHLFIHPSVRPRHFWGCVRLCAPRPIRPIDRLPLDTPWLRAPFPIDRLPLDTTGRPRHQVLRGGQAQAGGLQGKEDGWNSRTYIYDGIRMVIAGWVRNSKSDT